MAKKPAAKKATVKASPAEKAAPKAEKAAPKKAVAKATAVKKVEAKTKTKPAKNTMKKGDKYSCSVCGMVVAVDTLCGCVETCDIVCCGKPMKPKK